MSTFLKFKDVDQQSFSFLQGECCGISSFCPLFSLVLKFLGWPTHQEFRDDDTVLVGEVDCVGSGKAKCKELDIKAYPQVKCLGWGSLRSQGHGNGAQWIPMTHKKAGHFGDPHPFLGLAHTRILWVGSEGT